MNTEKAPPERIDRFMKQVAIQSNGCWHWTGARISGRYGETKGVERKVDCYAHRYSYLLFNGPIPEGKLVRHRCNNTICVNPEHLLIGTMVENYQDALDAGTAPTGVRNGNAKHSKEVISQIRSLYQDGLNQRAIGRALNISYKVVWEVVHGRRRQYE
jgi:hypothetical protein